MTISAKPFQRMVIFFESLNEWFIKNLISVILNVFLCKPRIHLDLQSACVQKCTQLKDPNQPY